MSFKFYYTFCSNWKMKRANFDVLCFYQRSQQRPKHCMPQWLLAHLIFQKGETALPGTVESFHKILCSGKLISGAASLKKFTSESLIIHGESLYCIYSPCNFQKQSRKNFFNNNHTISSRQMIIIKKYIN